MSASPLSLKNVNIKLEKIVQAEKTTSKIKNKNELKNLLSEFAKNKLYNHKTTLNKEINNYILKEKIPFLVSS